MLFVTTRDSEVTQARAGLIAVAPLVVGFAPFALVVGATVGATAIRAQASPEAGHLRRKCADRDCPHARDRWRGDRGPHRPPHPNAVARVQRVAVTALAGAAAWFRIAAAPMIVDPVWAVAEAWALEPGSPREIRAHYFGSAIGLFVAWSVSSSPGSCSVAASTATPSASRRRSACCGSWSPG